jgi:hypothetical protein
MRATTSDLFAKIFEGDLDAFIVQPLIVAAELLATVGPAMEELAHHPHWGVRLTFKFRCAAHVNRAVKVIIINVMIDLADVQPIGRLAANAQHFGSCTDRGNMLVAPPLLVIEAEASDRGTIAVERDVFRTGSVVAQIVWERHFRTGDEIDDHANLFTLGGVRLYEEGATRDGEQQCLDTL